MHRRQVILSSWWHEESLNKADHEVLRKFGRKAKELFADNFKIPVEAEHLSEAGDYVYMVNKEDDLINLDITTKSIELTYLGHQDKLEELLKIYKKIFRKLFDYHKSNKIDFDHYHFFVETTYMINSKEKIRLFKEKLGIGFEGNFNSKELSPASANVQYEINDHQTVIMSLIMKNWKTYDRFEYKIKVDAGKVPPGLEDMKSNSEKTIGNHQSFTKEIINHEHAN